MNPTTHFLTTRHGRIAYRETGHGPVALFLHGLPLSSREWRGVMPDLAHLRRCIAIDQLGLGDTEPVTDADLSYAGQADMVAAFLDAAGIDQVDLVGNDTGGGVSQLVLARHPARVRSLLLTNCEVHDCWPNDLLRGFYGGVADGTVVGLLQAILADTALGQQQLGALVYEDPATLSAETIRACIAPIVQSAERIALFQRLCRWEPCREQIVASAPELRRSTVPSCVLWGTGDVVFDTAPSLDWLSRNLGGLRDIVRVDGAKLFFPEEHPGKVVETLETFWRSLAR